MKKTVLGIIMAIFAITLSLSPMSVFADNNQSNNNQNSTARTCSTTGPLGVPTWYRGLVDENCEIKWPSGDGNSDHGIDKFITIVLINISDMVLRIIGVASFVFMIWGGFRYMLAQGEPASIASAKKTITNALVGLIIAMLSVILVNFAFNFFM